MTVQDGPEHADDVRRPRWESPWELLRRWWRARGRHKGIQYWLMVQGYRILAAFAAVFALNGVINGWQVAYDVSLQIDSPWDTEVPVPWLALPLSLAGWLVVTGFAGALAGYVVIEVTENRLLRNQSKRSWTGLIPRLERLQYSRHEHDIPRYFAIRFVLRHRHHRNQWQVAQDHWEKIVERFFYTDAVDRTTGPRQVLRQAVRAAAYFLHGLSGRCPECGLPRTGTGEGDEDR